jgi:hypothetical protein
LPLPLYLPNCLLNWGEGVIMFVLSMCINFAILAGTVSKFISKIVARIA